ncbi:MAG: hypothetical protein PF517_18575 [Salinivirgaceae bacterium]|jgi:hypothetical protein|nr:hypothetical protein [Salinivirgaceae bacterium]
MTEKQFLAEHLLSELNLKADELRQVISDAKESRASDTKSSAGDKFETGRSMMQMEIEKNETQLFKTLKLINEIKKINYLKPCAMAEFGSLVKTNSGNYFIAVAFGKLHLNNLEYYCISLASPIGQALNNHTVNESIEYMGKHIVILDIL